REEATQEIGFTPLREVSLRLVSQNEQAGRSDVTVHEEHVQHVHQINGQKTE
ncbi:hypothetical protein BaRGS_00040357, partial [Batillaria attramentaria]